ncbi:MAG: cysteine hydrolase family protein [Thermomicrobiales bacterium]
MKPLNDYLTPDAAHIALLTIDTQRDFTLPGAPAEIAGTMAVVPSMVRLLHAFRRAGKPIIHVVRLYQEDGANVDLCRRADIEGGARMVVPGSDGAELVDALKPTPTVRLDAERLLDGTMQEIGPCEWAMYKPRWGAFYQTPLEAHLRDLGMTTLVVCGCNYPNCPRAALYEASERDFRTILATDAVSGLYERGVRELRAIGVALIDTDECVALITP